MEASSILHQVTTPHHSLEDVMGCSKQAQQQQQQQQQQKQQQEEKRLRPQPEQSLRCPRCDSTNTKFCYYNNYSLSQPRYFCKGCRRYWTQGGTLRNVPVGGGCRKNKRPSSSTTASCKRVQDQHSPLSTTNSGNSNPLLPTLPAAHAFQYDPSDLTLAFARLQQEQASVLQAADHDNANGFPLPTNPNPSGSSFLDILRGGFLESGYQNLFYGFGGGGSGDQGVADQVPVLPFGEVGSGAAVTVKQELCKNGEGDHGKVMMGLQWQVGGGESNDHSSGGANMFVDYGRDYWGNIGAPWHGLVNSSLM